MAEVFSHFPSRVSRRGGKAIENFEFALIQHRISLESFSSEGKLSHRSDDIESSLTM
jgi:hypothetical protein